MSYFLLRSYGRPSSQLMTRTLASSTPKMKPFRKHPFVRDDRPLVQKQREINQKLEAEAEKLGLPWRIVAASILHRYPTVTPDIPIWEREFAEVQNKIENINRQEYKERTFGTKADIIADENPTFDEIAATLPFTPASRVTEADLKNDRRSLERKCPESLYLIVKRNRQHNQWQFPQGKWIEGESLRQSSERISDRTTGKINRWFVSNSPMGHYCYAYSPEVQQARKQYGAKVFFYRAQYIDGDVKLETRLYTDYAWIGKSELKEYFDENFAEYLDGLLIK